MQFVARPLRLDRKELGRQRPLFYSGRVAGASGRPDDRVHVAPEEEGTSEE